MFSQAQSVETKSYVPVGMSKDSFTPRCRETQ